MEKDFAPYEESLELKELGFDEPCFFSFDNCSTPMRCTDLRTNEEKFNGVNYNSSSYTSQPLFSQAFRWFREKHNFDLFWKPMSMIGITCYYDIEIHHPKYIWDKPPKVTGKSYPEAELACLKKLIEIAKTK